MICQGPSTDASRALSSPHGGQAAVIFSGTLVAIAVATGLTVDTLFTALVAPTLAELTN